MNNLSANYRFQNGRDTARRLFCTARRPCLLLSIAIGLLLAGCLSKPALVRQTFALQNPPAANATPSKGGGVLVLQSVDVSPLFAGQSLVYRTGPDTYETDPYAGFLVRPGRTLAIPMSAYLRNSGAFKDVVEPGSPLKADRVLEVQVGELYGDFTKSGEPASVLSLRMLLLETANGGAGKVLLQKDYTRRVPVKQNTAAAVVAGYDQALAEIMAEVAKDLAGAGAG